MQNSFNRRDFLATTTASFAMLSAVPLLRADEKKDPYADAVLVDGLPPALAPGSFTVAVLPDTQNYSQKFPDTFRAQTQWLVDHKEERNIQFVLHLGDITNNSQPVEWENARSAMNTLDGHLPYFFVPGNHDYGKKGGTEDRSTLLNEYFPAAKFESLPTFGGLYDREPGRMENSFHKIRVGERKFLILALEFGPRADVVRWANEVLTKHADHEAILITHAYMYFDSTRYDWKKLGKAQSWNPHAYPYAATNDDIHDGEELWSNLVSKHHNVIMTLNGHVLNDGLGYLPSATADDRVVHQILVNFQMRPKGGDGWLRLLEFQADQKTVQTYDYSPTRNQHNQSGQNQFQFTLSPAT